MFKHALTHDVAYESVVLERRRALHRTIGAAIEELYADRLAEFYETLAHHFGRAEEWERALAYRERAAEKAAESYANRSVIAHVREALAIADRLGGGVSSERRRALEERLAFAHFYVSEYGASGDAFARAAEHGTVPKLRALDLVERVAQPFLGPRLRRVGAQHRAAPRDRPPRAAAVRRRPRDDRRRLPDRGLRRRGHPRAGAHHRRAARRRARRRRDHARDLALLPRPEPRVDRRLRALDGAQRAGDRRRPPPASRPPRRVAGLVPRQGGVLPRRLRPRDRAG